jgi:hypothetical protein
VYIIMKQKQNAPYSQPHIPHEVAKTRQIATDRCRTLNAAAKSYVYWVGRVKPIIDASGTKAKQISF